MPNFDGMGNKRKFEENGQCCHKQGERCRRENGECRHKGEHCKNHREHCSRGRQEHGNENHVCDNPHCKRKSDNLD